MGLSLANLAHQVVRGAYGVTDSLLGTNLVGDYDSKNNYDLQKANLAWQRDVQMNTWQREDTAVQRRVADLKAAGINPILAAGQAANSGAVVSTTAPQRETQKYSVLQKIGLAIGLDKTLAEVGVLGATKANLEAQNANLLAQNDLVKAQTIKTIADATGWTTEEVALKVFGIGFSSTTKKPNKDIKTLKFSDDPSRNDYYHNYLDNIISGTKANPV